MTGACLGPATISLPRVFRQSSMGCGMEAPSRPDAISSWMPLSATPTWSMTPHWMERAGKFSLLLFSASRSWQALA